MIRYHLSASECTMTKTITATEQPSFIKRKHELDLVYKQVESGSKEAIQLLIDTMNSTDEKVSLKIKLECADKLISYQVKIADIISKDQLVRQIADFKSKGNPIVIEQGEGKPSQRQAPRLDLMNVQHVE